MSAPSRARTERSWTGCVRTALRERRARGALPKHRRHAITITNPSAVSGDGYLTEREAAAYYSASPRTLRNWRSLGIGPSYVKIGGAVRYRRAALDAYVIEQGGAA